ncbi:MAG: hypothetical protein AAF202_02855 [Pseudomonadota bacterium]
MKHSIKVLALAAPLSFVIGLVLTYYQDQLEQDPNFLKETVNLLVSDQLDFNEIKPLIDTHSYFVINVIECTDTDDCREKLKTKPIDLAMLPFSIIKELMQSDLLLEIKDTTSELRSRLHVDFRRPKVDPEGRFSIPIFWNVLGYLCHKSQCDQLEHESLKSVEEKNRKDFVFWNSPQEVARLKDRGLWEDYQYHEKAKLQTLLEERKELLVQWPSGALRQKQLYQMKDYSYRLPNFGASLFLFAAVIPKHKPDSAARAMPFLSELMTHKLVTEIHSKVPAAFAFIFEDKTQDKLDPRQRSSQLRNLELYKLRFEDVVLEP